LKYDIYTVTDEKHRENENPASPREGVGFLLVLNSDPFAVKNSKKIRSKKIFLS
jgi:hypothetical protein